MEANPFRNASSLTRRLLRVKRDSPRTTNPRECRCFIIAIHLPRRLAFGAERRGDETKSKREECPAVHQRMILSLGNGNYGVVFPAGDADAFADAVRRLHGDPVLAAGIAERAFERAVEAYSVEAMVRATSAAYERARAS